MLDIRLVRENPEFVKKNLGKRQNPEYLKMLDELVESDMKWRSILQDVEELRRQRNEISRKITEAIQQKKDISALKQEAKELPEKIKKAEAELNELEEKNHSALMKLPNLLEEDVPFGKDENDNKEIKSFGSIKKFSFELKHHGLLTAEKNLADYERAVKISGTGFYILKNELALMELALQRYAIDFLVKKGYSLILPPFLIKRKPYEGVTSLDDFENVMYKIENEDKYLIATAEHPIISMHMNEILPEEELPLKYVGLSACFRKEVGKHGLDERGLFRVHQFNKVEQVVFCRPEESRKYFNELISNAESLFQKLRLPCRVVAVCTGDIGIVAAKKYDIEAWSPREKKYFEVHSGSNCTSYQAVRLNVKYRKKNSMDKEYVHTLNSTAIATGRALRAIIENFQTEKGTIKVPKVLQPYMNGIKEIPSEKKAKPMKGKAKKKARKK
ncbi:MAG: serine--tRNA ligase [Candidatus Diapherotrites archaeon]